MKTLKKIDLWIQGILIGGGVLYAGIAGRGSYLHPYYAVGAWQLMSFVSHLCIDKNLFFRKERNEYGLTNLWLLVIGCVSLVFTPLLIFFLLGLLVVSPVLAAWYFSICLRELWMMNRKELIHIK